MTEQRLRRRLAAIMAADVVSYTRLMDLDEAGTLARLKALRRDLIDPRTAAYGGRIFKNTGDGALAEFPSATDAVQCALEIQRELAAQNKRLPEQQRIVLRVGVSLGDVIVDGDDLFGNGVNVAARMEALANPGDICVSANVYEHVAGAIAATFEDLGEQNVKNLPRPVHCYRLPVAGISPVPAPSASAAEVPALPEKPSIAVLPFQNMSGDPEQEYFAEGMSEEIITGLSAIRWLTVIARNSSFSFREKALDVRAIARELGVRYLLEGSVRKSGNRVRITVRLVKAESAEHLWTDRFEGLLSDVFDLQDRIAEGVVGAIEPSVRTAEIDRATRKRPQSLSAYDYLLQAMAQMFDVRPEARVRALELVDKALAIDPDYAEAHGVAAWCYFARSIWEGGMMDEYHSKANFHAQTVLRLQSKDASTLAHAAIALAASGNPYGIALGLIDRAIALSPNSVHAHGHGAVISVWAGRYDNAIRLAERALQLSPFDQLSVMPLAAIAGASHMTAQYEKALEAAGRALQIYPTHGPSHMITIASLIRLDRKAEAQAAAQRLLKIFPRARAQSVLGEEFSKALKEAGVPG